MSGRRSSVDNFAAGVATAGTTQRRGSKLVQSENVGAATGVYSHNDEIFRKMSMAVPNLAEISKDASTAAEKERTMSFREGVRLYPKAIFFSFGLSLAVIMEGYDTWLLGSFWTLPAFAKKFGEPLPPAADGTIVYNVSPDWQNALGLATGAAQILGLCINGIVSERYGYRKTMMGSLIAISSFIFVTFFAKNIQMLFAGYVLSGLPWGVFQTITTTYASEVVPVTLRPYLTTYVNLCWVIGQLIASGILKGMVGNSTQWAYRIPYAIQWIWPLPIFIVCFFAPESPWWLVRHNKLDEARHALRRLCAKGESDADIDDTVAMIVHTNELEAQQTVGTSYWDCFRTKVDRRRTELTIGAWVIQQTSGSPMIGWGTYFMGQVGLSAANQYSLGVAQSGFGFIGTVGSWFLMPHFGRRTLYLWGQIVMFIGLVIIGCMGIPKTSGATGWTIGAFMLLLTFVYDFTVGPVCYSLVAEMPSTRLRIKSVVISRNVYNLLGMIISVLQPRFMNPEAWNWGAKTAFFWAGANLLGLVWTYFRLPEPKGLTYADLDVLFENGISARQFRKVKIDAYRSENYVVTGEDDDEKMIHEVKGHL